MKRMLMTATVPSMIGQFNMNNIKLLQKMGYEVDVACDFKDRSVWTEERIEKFIHQIEDLEIKYFQIDYSRSPLKIAKHIKAYRQLSRLFEERQYNFVHCHTPVASIISRIVAHQKHVKCIYTAHGFHFYNGAPARNWIIFYPIEKFFSRWTDILITINKEDYKRAKDKFHAKKVVYIPGVGVDLDKFYPKDIVRYEIRKELQIPESAFLLLSVGELSMRKNHQIVIKALGEIDNRNIYYAIAGQGHDKEEYEKLIIENHLEKNVFLLGMRTDIRELCLESDCFIHPSIREGLGIAPLEAMACGLPLISSYVNGIKDYTEDGVTGCCINPYDCHNVLDAIVKMYSDFEFREKCGKHNIEVVKQFDIKETQKIMEKLYLSI